MKKIAFIGLGAMGTRMAKNLLLAGYPVHVWNRSPARYAELVSNGAESYDTPRHLVQSADIVFAMVTDDAASRNVWLAEESGAINGLNPGTVVIECSTLTPQWCRELSTHVQENDAHFLDAPVIGSRPQAEAGQLIHLVGGDEKILQQVRVVLASSAAAIHYIGAAGSGMTLKLAVNALFASQVAALSEILGALHNTGITLEQSVSILNALPTTSAALKGIGELIATENYTPLFPIELVVKDLGYMQQMAESSAAKLPNVKNTKMIYQNAINAGYDKDNISGVVQLYV